MPAEKISNRPLLNILFLIIGVLAVVVILQTISTANAHVVSSNLRLVSQNATTETAFKSELFADAQKDDTLYSTVISAGQSDLVVKALKSKDVEQQRQFLQENIQKVQTLPLAEQYELVLQLYRLKSFFSPVLSDLFPKYIETKNYFVRTAVAEKLVEDSVGNIAGIDATYSFTLLEKSSNKAMKEYPIRMIGNFHQDQTIYHITGLLFGGNAYINFDHPIEEIKSNSLRVIPSSVSTVQSRVGISSPEQEATPILLQAYSSFGFNRVPRQVAVLIPYNSSNPLNANYAAILNPILNNVHQFYLDNSENQFNLTFTLIPVLDPSYSPQNILNTGNIQSIIFAGDPTINYSNYSFAMIIVDNTISFGGFATMFPDSSTSVLVPGYYATNEPLASAVPVIGVDMGNISAYNREDFAMEHEIGHILSFWNPQNHFEYFYGFIPHASGIEPGTPCQNQGSILYCQPAPYGDGFDTMGVGRGSFSQHSAVFRTGLRLGSSIQHISNSGTFTLCDIESPASGCPQELLLDNPNGVNLAVELRSFSGADAIYGPNCSANAFNAIQLRAVDIEEGGALGNIFFDHHPPGFFYQYGGDVAQLYNSQIICQIPGYQIYNNSFFPINQTANTPLANITLQSITTLPNGARQATVNISNYSVPPCVSLPPAITLNLNGSSLHFYHNLLTADQRYPYQMSIQNKNLCTTSIPQSFSVQLSVATPTGIQTANSVISLLPGQVNYNFDIPIPPGLANNIGNHAYTITVSEVGNPNNNNTLTGNLWIEQYTPKIIGPFPHSYCQDQDPIIPFSFQTLGADVFSQYPNVGAIAAPNPPIPGYPPVLYVPDLCQAAPSGDTSFLISDIVCGGNTGYSQFANDAFILIKDCRMEINPSIGIANPNSYCTYGWCT